MGPPSARSALRAAGRRLESDGRSGWNGSEGFDVSPDGKEIWVANAQDGTVSIIDAAKKHVTQTLAVEAADANRLKFTLDGKLALISTLGGPDLIIVDTATHNVIKRLPIGRGAAGILMQPDGPRAFVACSPDDYVAVIDLKSLEVAGHIDVGGEPDGLAWATGSNHSQAARFDFEVLVDGVSLNRAGRCLDNQHPLRRSRASIFAPPLENFRGGGRDEHLLHGFRLAVGKLLQFGMPQHD